MVVEGGKGKQLSLPLPIGAGTPKLSLSDGSPSAFSPYKPTVTVLTNLQRGNTRVKTQCIDNQELSFFQLAAKGDLTIDRIRQEGIIDNFDCEKCGLTPLMWACAYGQSHTVEDLLEAGASVNLTNSSGETAMHYAAQAGYPEVIKTLLTFGANVNCVDEKGNTAILLAARDDHPLTVSLLLSCGADFTYKNTQGFCAHKIAVDKQHLKVQQVLENHMKQLLSPL